MKIESLLPFIKEIDRLKTIERQTLIHTGGRRENSAEHSWHLALLHDIVEIDAGDIIVYADQANKAVSEADALKRIMSLLPEELGSDFTLLWNEFEESESTEAKYVSAIDRYLPIFSNYLNEGYSWKNHQISSQRIIDKCQRPINEGLPPLWEVAKLMLEESIEEGHLSRS